MAARKKTGTIKVDLSALPKGVQDAVGAELALSIVKNLRLGKRVLIVGKLGPGTYGIVAPDAALIKQIGGLAKKG
jgi:hypothetical protein